MVCNTYCEKSSNISDTFFLPYRPPEIPENLAAEEELPDKEIYPEEKEYSYTQEYVEEPLQVTICKDMEGDYFCVDLPNKDSESLTTICDYDDLAGYYCKDI